MTRALAILVGVTLAVLVALALVVGKRPGGASDFVAGEPVFPALATGLERVASVEVQRAAGTFVLDRGPGGWKNLGMGGYPALGARVDGAVATLAGLTRVEPKTGVARLFPELGVEDVGAGAGSTRITLKDASGAVLADVIVGREQRAGAGRKRAGVYIRVPGESRAWLADGSMDVHHDAPDWSERRLADIPPEQVQTMTLRREDGERIAVRRDPSGNGALTLADLPPGSKVRRASLLRYLSGIFDDLTMLGARPATARDGESAAGTEVAVETTAGVRITLRPVSVTPERKLWATLAAGRAAGIPLSDRGAETLARLRAVLGGWEFLLPQAVAERLRIRLDDIIVNARD